MRKFSICLACIFMLAVMGCGDNSGDPTARITLKVEPAEVAPGGSAIITATVTKAGIAGAVTSEADTTTTITPYAWGEKVTFKLLTANGASLSTLVQKTDGNGIATTVYTAGNNYEQDVVQATLENDMSASVVIKKTGSLIGARISSLEASPTTVAEGQTAVITATVTDGDSTQPMMGEAVTFTIATNESGACVINATNACVTSVTVNSDAGGIAEAVYKAGGNSSAVDVYDSVRASLSNGSSRAVNITRSASTVLGYALTVTPVPTILVSKAGQSIVTANVKNNSVAVSGITVTFSVVSGTIGGTVSPGAAITDGSGNAVTIYKGAVGASTGATDAVQASITVDGATYKASTVITAP